MALFGACHQLEGRREAVERIVPSELYIQTFLASQRMLFGDIDEAEERRMLQMKIDLVVQNADQFGVTRELLLQSLDPKLILQGLPEMEATVRKMRMEGTPLD
jgi:hypothetical protein